MTRRSDRAGIDLIDIPAADPLTAQQQIEPGYADNHTACQQNPLLMGIYETADKREGEQSQGRSPTDSPDTRPRAKVRGMHSSPRGPTGIETIIPTIRPLRNPKIIFLLLQK